MHGRSVERRPLASGRARVFIVITLSEIGGAQRYVELLAPGLVSEFDLVVAAHGHGPLEEKLRALGVRFVSLRHMRRPIRPWRDVLALVELLGILRRERPHIVHANSTKAGVIARLAAFLTRVPVRVFTVHGWAFSAHSGLASTSYRWAERLMCHLTTLTICVSESDVRKGLRARTCRAGRSVLIRNAVDVSVNSTNLRAQTTPLVVSVGRLQRPKDYVTLIRALSILNPVAYRAEIVGDGPLRAEIETEIRTLGLDETVSLLGERADVGCVLASADVFVLSSDSEGLPMSILEAMAAGLPVVASSVGGVSEIVEHGVTGLLVPPRNPASLADSIRSLLENPGLRNEMGTAARTRARTSFGLATFLNAHVDVYRTLLADEGFRFVSSQPTRLPS